MKKKITLVTIAVTVVVALLCACIYAIVSDFGKGKKEITVYAPDGAPALALAKLLHEDTDTDGTTYRIVSANGIEARVTYDEEKKNADVCVLPLTDANLHLKSGENYQMLGVVTHGNFYLLSEQTTAYNAENLEELIGKKVGFVQLGKLPGLIFQSILRRENIPYKVQSDLQSCENDVVNLINVAPTAVTKGTGYDVFAVPEPAASLKIKAAQFNKVGNVQELYGGENGYAQAVVVAKKSLIKNNSLWVENFMEKLAENAAWLETASVEAVLSAVNSHLDEALTPSLTDKNLTKEVVAACGVYFKTAAESKTEIDQTIAALAQINGNLTAFSKEFYFDVE